MMTSAKRRLNAPYPLMIYYVPELNISWLFSYLLLSLQLDQSFLTSSHSFAVYQLNLS